MQSTLALQKSILGNLFIPKIPDIAMESQAQILKIFNIRFDDRRSDAVLRQIRTGKQLFIFACLG